MNVLTYAENHVEDQDQPKFFEIMAQWDGSDVEEVQGAFYDFDVLEMKKEEAVSWV